MSASARAATIVASGVARWCALAPAVRVARRIVPAIALALGLATVPALAGAAIGVGALFSRIRRSCSPTAFFTG